MAEEQDIQQQEQRPFFQSPQFGFYSNQVEDNMVQAQQEEAEMAMMQQFMDTKRVNPAELQMGLNPQQQVSNPYEQDYADNYGQYNYDPNENVNDEQTDFYDPSQNMNVDYGDVSFDGIPTDREPKGSGKGDFRGTKDVAAVRHNNPGAMWPGPSSKKFGSTTYEVLNDRQKNKIATFPTVVHGGAAQFDLLYNKYTDKSLEQIIKIWSGGNHYKQYAQSVSKQTGLKSDTIITKEMMRDPKIALPIAKAMSQIEAGREYPMNSQEWQNAYTMFYEVNFMNQNTQPNNKQGGYL